MTHKTARTTDEAMQPGEGRSLLRAMAYMRSYRRDAAGALVSLLLVTAANLAAPQLMRLAIDTGIARGRSNAVVWAVLGLLAVAVVRGVFTFLQGFLAERASQGVAYDLRDALFARIQRLSFSYHDRVETGQLLTRVTNDVEQIRTLAGTGIVQLAAAITMLAGSVVLLILINWRLALVSLTTVPAMFVLLLRFVRRIGPMFGRVQATLGRLNSILQENLAGMRVVRAFGRADYEEGRYETVNRELRDENLRTLRSFSNNFPFVFLFANLGTLAVVWYGGLESIAGRLTVGELVAFNTYLTFLFMPLLTIGFLAAGISRAQASSVRVFEVLDAPLEVRDARDAVDLPPIRCRVEFRDVRFRYPGGDREVLRGVSFRVEPGQTVALLGSTGSGKSTLVNLLPRFYDVTGGSVVIDDHDVRDVTLGSLRGQIGTVLQQALLFSGTVRDNIAYGRPDARQEEIEAAARAAQADGFIQGLPLGYDTVVGERGVGLSGGQRQRIAIARALLVDPFLLILDDSMSAVDARTEAAIQEALDRFMRRADRTVFVIAQRISTVRDADLILVMDEGRIAAQGTHDQLLSESPLYGEILGSQLQDDQPAGATPVITGAARGGPGR
jgi:ATP-binding cassette subfamily B protein